MASLADDTAALIARCRELAEAATPGPWRTWIEGEGEVWGGDPCVLDLHQNVVAEPRTPEDTRFIAHAREDVPALIAALEAAQAKNERLHGVVAAVDAALEGALDQALNFEGEYRVARERGDALAAAARECDFNETLQEYEPQLLARIRAALAGWERDTPADKEGGK